jgi:FkbM family methyltransferase
MSLLNAVGKPQYLLRPRWAFRRLLIAANFVDPPNSVELPWGARLEIDLRDTLGHALAAQGLYDIVTTELVWRLTEKGECAFDVGANIGYFTTLLADRVGLEGHVEAFEPHPETFARLERNISRQTKAGRSVQIHNTALSDFDGPGMLDNFPAEFHNASYAFLTEKPSHDAKTVQVAKGERFVDARKIGVMKIDAQWHEAQVLRGFGESLRNGTFRDIVFEEDNPYPAESHRILQEAGYSILWFEEHFRGPKVIRPDENPKTLRTYDIRPSFLATLNPQRARDLLSAPGWQSF